MDILYLSHRISLSHVVSTAIVESIEFSLVLHCPYTNYRHSNSKCGNTLCGIYLPAYAIADTAYGFTGIAGGLFVFRPFYSGPIVECGCARSPLIIKAATGTEHGEGTCRDRPFSTSGSTFSGRRCRGREGCSAIGRPAGGRHRGSHPPVLGGSLARLVWDWVLWCFAVGCVRSVGAGTRGGGVRKGPFAGSGGARRCWIFGALATHRCPCMGLHATPGR